MKNANRWIGKVGKCYEDEEKKIRKQTITEKDEFKILQPFSVGIENFLFSLCFPSKANKFAQ